MAPGGGDLARIFHASSTAVAQSRLSADFSSVGPLDVVSTTPAQPSVGKVTIQATLSRLATNKCEICGLAWAPTEDVKPPAGQHSLRIIRERIMAVRNYPALARMRGWEGRTTVRFRVGPGGEPRLLDLVSSSGVAALDRASVKAVEEGAPYPPVEGWVTVPITFLLR